MDSPGFIAICVAAAVGCFMKWYYDTSERAFNTFLDSKLREKTREEIENKTERQIKIEEGLADVGNPTTCEKLKQYSMMVMIIPSILFTILGAPLFSIVAIGAGYKLPELYISYMKDKKIKVFEENLADALSQLLAIIQAGQTQTQGFKVLAEMPYPIGTEFGRIYHDIDTGASLEQALEDFYQRIPLRDIRLFNIGAIISQKATPAVTISTLKNIISTIQKRESQKKSIKSAVAGGKLTALLLALLPLFLFLGVETIMPEVVNEFLATGEGKLLYVLAIILDGVGYYVARRITSADRMIQY